MMREIIRLALRPSFSKVGSFVASLGFSVSLRRKGGELRVIDRDHSVLSRGEEIEYGTGRKKAPRCNAYSKGSFRSSSGAEVEEGF